MVYYLISCRSLTYAQRAARLLEQAGLNAAIMRMPRGLSPEGCAYCVRISERGGHTALAILRENGARIGRVFLQYPNGEAREVPL